MKDRLYLVPHTHYDAVVFKTREEYLQMGLPIILQALQCLEDDPRYRFVLDQVCYIRPFLERYPEEAARLREFVAQGRLQITCGMDSMADVNTPSGESFVRQVLYGKRYIEETLGADVTVGWGLDTFGHHPQMPQLLLKAGFDSYFFARGVPSPHTPSEFTWEGIDGSRVLALWLPYSYGVLFGSPRDLPGFAQFMRSRYDLLKPLAQTRNVLGLAGVDLGPAEPHVTELAAELNARGEAPFELVVATPDEFLAALKADLDEGQDLPIVRADLNPIFQGCYSSRIEVKQANRELERLLTNVEKLDAVSAWLGLPTDAGSLERAWEPVLFNQFHDCICGVQVDKVFDDTMASYAYSRRLATDLLNERLDRLAERVDTRGDGIPLVVFNTLGWPRTDVVEVEIGIGQGGVYSLGLRDPDGQPIPLQVLEAERHADGGYRRVRVLFVAQDVPALGHAVYRLIPNGAQDLVSAVWLGSGERPGSRPDLAPTRGFIANEHLRAEFDLWTGALTSLRAAPDDWEALREGAGGNVVTRERDGGDFWQIGGALKAGMASAGVQRHPAPRAGEAELSCDQVGDGSVRHGPVMASFRVSHPFGKGWVTLEARVYAGVPRVDLHTEVLNNEEYVRYRVLFPTSIEGGVITHEIPFGATERPEQELPAQNWVDLNDGAHGVALLNRGLPGNNVDDGVMMLSLMRASQLVAYGAGGGYDPSVSSASGQDLGKRLAFDYALLAHQGDWREARVYRQGMAFNNPLLVRKVAPSAGDLPARWGLLRVEPDNVVVSALTQGRDGATMLRVYEAEGRAVTGARIALSAGVEAAHETDLLERHARQAVLADGALELDLGPFEIKTFALRVIPRTERRAEAQ